MASTCPAWSTIIPAYNESNRLPRYLDNVIDYFEHRGEPYEVLVVDDGSTDDTAQVVRRIAASCPAVQLCVLPRNRGKGYAVRAGMLHARGLFRLMADADGATPISEASRLETAVRSDHHVAVGSRVLREPSVVRDALPHRRLAGALFRVAVQCAGVGDIQDTQCGFKLFRGLVAHDLFSHIKTDGFAFDVELLRVAHQRGYRVAEVPVNWTHQHGSKVNVAIDGPRMLWQIGRCCWRDAHTALASRQLHAIQMLPWSGSLGQ